MKMKLDIEMVKLMKALRKCINSVDLKDIELYKNGEVIEISAESIEAFRFTGLSNIDFFDSEF